MSRQWKKLWVNCSFGNKKKCSAFEILKRINFIIVQIRESFAKISIVFVEICKNFFFTLLHMFENSESPFYQRVIINFYERVINFSSVICNDILQFSPLIILRDSLFKKTFEDKAFEDKKNILELTVEVRRALKSYIRARPKSAILSVPELDTRMFWGLTSRWTIRWLWRKSTPHRICHMRSLILSGASPGAGHRSRYAFKSC